MWDKPHLLRRITIMLVAGSVMLLAYSMLHYALQLPVFKLRTVQLTNAPQQVDVNQVNRLVKHVVGGSFFTIDLEQTRRAFEQLPWVRKVSVRRYFPWGLEVTLEEQVPMARWNGGELVNTYGEVFEGQSNLSLPEFHGEPDTSAQVSEMYALFGKQLAAIQKSITRINLSPRFAWQLQLNDGLVLELGREQMQQRLARFVAVYPYTLSAMTRKISYVDLRYHNGFAVNEAASVGRGAGVKVGSKNNFVSRV
jgi:cell division protein FtsQ